MNSELNDISSKPKTPKAERLVKQKEFNRFLCASLNVRSEVISIKKDILLSPENESFQLKDDNDFDDDESSKEDIYEERKGMQIIDNVK